VRRRRKRRRKRRKKTKTRIKEFGCTVSKVGSQTRRGGIIWWSVNLKICLR